MKHRLHAILALPLLLILAAGVSAHERKILPNNPGTQPGFMVLAIPDAHLAVTPPSHDFGAVWVGGQATVELTVANVSGSDSYDVTIAGLGGEIAVSPASFTLAPSPPGDSVQVTVTYAPGSVGTLARTLVVESRHAGPAAAPGSEALTVSLSGQGVLPPKLELDLPEYGLSDVDSFTFGLVSLRRYGFEETPTFDVVVANRGGATARNVMVNLGGPGRGWVGFGKCDESSPIADVCVGVREAGGSVTSTVTLGDIAPGEAVTTVWRVVPNATGQVAYAAPIRMDGAADKTFTLSGEVSPYVFPGYAFVGAENVAGHAPATETKVAGEVSDPLEDDPLGQLRVSGFDARSAFSVGEIDTVDLRGGNLTLAVPIGGEQPVRGALSYALRAVLNSDVWARRTRVLVDGDTPGPAVPRNAEHPNPAFNLGGGWSLHLGRLQPPRPYPSVSSQCQNTLRDERYVDTASRFVYVSPDGSSHEFYRELHGGEPVYGPGEGNRYDEETYLYARDGSFLRLRRLSATQRLVEEPGGLSRLFVKQSTPEPSLPDDWLLEEIRDRYGNKVTIDYAAAGGGKRRWTIRDSEASGGGAWRQVVLTFGDWNGTRGPNDPMKLETVTLPGFGGGTAAERVYRFAFTELMQVDRPARSAHHLALESYCALQGVPIDTRVNLLRLDEIELPDGSSYAFTYSTGGAAADLLIQSVKLPTGATLAYGYSDGWDLTPHCLGGGEQRRPQITHRTVSDPGGALLSERRYLREMRRTSDVPNTICEVHDPLHQEADYVPWSEQRVAVWNTLIAGAPATGSQHGSSLSVHHFNTYPFDGEGLSSGRSNLELNVMVSHEQQVGDLYLSSETWACPFDVAGGPSPALVTPTANPALRVAGQRIDDVLGAGCVRQEHVLADYDVALSNLRCDDLNVHCLRDSRLVASQTVHDSDGGKWVREDHSGYDGLGHFRSTTTRSSLQQASGPVVQTRFQNYHPDAGTLVTDAEHRVIQNVTPPAEWVLGTYRERYVIENGAGRGGEACFHPTLGHMTYERTWHTSTISTSNLSANRGTRDLVVRYAVDGEGELDLQRFFGADTYGGMPTGSGWCDNPSAWGAAQQEYAIDHDYQYGVLSARRVVGETVYEVQRAIDRHTGWTASETQDSGEVLSYHYDRLGRVEWITSASSASRSFDYQQQADGRWRLTAKIFPKGTGPATASPQPIRQYSARYDGLGRLIAEDLPKADGSTVTRTVSYHPAGGIRTLSALDNPAKNSVFEYDYRGRRTASTAPDGSKAAWLYTGARRIRERTCVYTGSSMHPGICNGTPNERVETLVERDWQGRAVSVTSPGGFATTFTYDPNGRTTSARRENVEPGGTVTQTRQWTYNGLGFLTREQIPERVATDFSQFTTRGQARRRVESSRVSDLVYDKLGRLRTLTVSGRLVKSFDYCDQAAVNAGRCVSPGGANGRLLAATRYNVYGAPENSAPGAWEVASSFGYDAVGRRTSRTTDVRWNADGGPPSDSVVFSQAWTHDDLGNVKTLTYPNGTFPGTGTAYAVDRTVSYGYGQGYYLTHVFEGTLGASLTYHASGLVHQVIHQGSGGTDRYSVDATTGMPRVSAIDLGVGSAGRLNLGAVTYDGAGNVRSIGSDSFRYDENSRLVHASVRGAASPYTYTYDNFDNLRNRGEVDPWTNRNQGATTTYDVFGNLTGTAGYAVAYDELDKTTALHEPGGASRWHVYDHADLRVLTGPVDGDWTWTLRDGLRVVRELTGLGSQIRHRKDYVWAGARLISSKSYPDTTERHYHEDQVGSSRLVTGNTFAQQVDYEPFGFHLDAGSGEGSVGFQGHEDDGLLTYMRGRMYLANGGRFLQVDPGRDATAWSQYAFAANNPIKLVDPLGREPKKKPYSFGGEAGMNAKVSLGPLNLEATLMGGPALQYSSDSTRLEDVGGFSRLVVKIEFNPGTGKLKVDKASAFDFHHTDGTISELSTPGFYNDLQANFFGLQYDAAKGGLQEETDTTKPAVHLKVHMGFEGSVGVVEGAKAMVEVGEYLRALDRLRRGECGIECLHPEILNDLPAVEH